MMTLTTVGFLIPFFYHTFFIINHHRKVGFNHKSTYRELTYWISDIRILDNMLIDPQLYLKAYIFPQMQTQYQQPLSQKETSNLE